VESRDEVLLLLRRSGICDWREGRAKVSREEADGLGYGMVEGCPAEVLAYGFGFEEEGGTTNCDRGW